MTLKLINAPTYCYASWWRRLASNCLDSSVFLASIPTFFVGGIFWRTVAVLFVLKAAFYFAKGATFGRFVTGTRLVDFHTGEEPGTWRIVARGMAHVFDILSFGLGFLWPLRDDKRQTFADKVMYTVVVVEDREPLAKQTSGSDAQVRTVKADGRSFPRAS